MTFRRLDTPPQAYVRVRRIITLALGALVRTGGVCVFLVTITFSVGALLSFIKIGDSSILERTIKWHKQTHTFLATQFNEYEQIGSIDILILGPSRAYSNYDITEIESSNYQAFSFGTSAQTPKQSYYFLKYALARKKPKLIIYDFYSRMFSTEGVEALPYLLHDAPLDLEMLQMAAAHRSLIPLRVVVAEVIDRLRHPRPANVIIPNNGNRTYVGKGYAVKLSKNSTLTAPRAYPMLEDQVESYMTLLDLAAASGIPVVTVLGPPFEQREDMPASVRKDWDAFRSTLAKRGAPIVDASLFLPKLDPTTLFADREHLNKLGGTIFTRALMEHLQAKGLLPPPRDPAQVQRTVFGVRYSAQSHIPHKFDMAATSGTGFDLPFSILEQVHAGPDGREIELGNSPQISVADIDLDGRKAPVLRIQNTTDQEVSLRRKFIDEKSVYGLGDKSLAGRAVRFGVWVTGIVVRRFGWRRPRRLGWLADGIRWLLTFHLVCFAWVFFRAATLTEASAFLSSIAHWREGSALSLFTGETTFLVAALAGIALVELTALIGPRFNFISASESSPVLRYLSIGFLASFIVYFGAFQQGRFLYFQF
ncbi:hypothetical protein [Paramagnetospirillum magnetotacticum]|nr:hypothetical protein [Paramagnetospirillum magnetotacticum]